MDATAKHEAALERVYAGLRPGGDGFVEVPTALFVGSVDIKMPPLPPIAFYFPHSEENSGQLMRAADQPFSALALSAHEHVLIRSEELPHLKKYVDHLLASPQASGGLAQEKRMEILRRSAIRVVDDLFQSPTPENITRSTKVVSSFVHVLMKDPKAYLLLSQLSSHDPYTLQHSVGTAVNCIILARKVGIQDETQLCEVGIAGLLHDIGKVKVKKEIINKNGPLDELEWEEMRSHASEGYEIVKNHPDLSDRTKRAILEHHEDNFGTGYPKGLKADAIDPFAKIVCICDIYNALTTNRSYSKARTPFDAFQFIREKLAHKIDQELFKHLVQIYGGSYDPGQ